MPQTALRELYEKVVSDPGQSIWEHGEIYELERKCKLRNNQASEMIPRNRSAKPIGLKEDTEDGGLPPPL